MNGFAVAQGMADIRTLPVSSFLDFVWHMLTRNADDKAVEKFRRTLWMPPKGVVADARSPWSAEAETRAFQAVKAMTTGNAPKAITDMQGSMRERAAAAGKARASAAS
ncbi:hypothetical protein SEA_NICOLE72_30 [Microbacterium phage Nicole72]|uniref:Uncharacterized protein n=1 Tax=Microbacterium phage Nicole72 TaxID=3062838 RepID=A0ACD4UIF3_9CAUD|nr:hypothetical protein SEA_NICOLE72_30 [Microbacterium phage Nicole72]